MTDRPDAPMNDAPDERDPGIAALLDVEPLDDVTRARLVRNAVAAADAQPVPAHHRRVTRWIAAAAASVVVVVGAGVALTVGGPDDSQPTASRPAAKAPGDELRDTAQQQLDRGATPESPAAAPSANEFGERATDAVPALGDLGEVADPAALRRAVRRATASGTFAPACSLAVNPTRDRVVSAGTGTVDGEPATVFIVERAGGGRRAVAIVNAGCTARKSVTL